MERSFYTTMILAALGSGLLSAALTACGRSAEGEAPGVIIETPGPHEPPVGPDTSCGVPGDCEIQRWRAIQTSPFVELSGTIYDSVSGLQWEPDTTAYLAWNEAATYCRTLDLGNFTDWRLPSRAELLSIHSYDDSAPALDADAFPLPGQGSTGAWFWTSSSLPDPTYPSAWRVGHLYGLAVPSLLENASAVRCVRVMAPRYREPLSVLADVVDDPNAELSWQRVADAGTHSAAAALALCDALVLDGADDWRVPSAKELLSLMDLRRMGSGPLVDPADFPEPNAGLFWTSSSTNPSNHWWVDFTNGRLILGDVVTLDKHVRCVR